jgi:hypothetical protein
MWASPRARWAVLLPLLFGAAWLAWFGDRTPARKPAAPSIVGPAPQRSAAQTAPPAVPDRAAVTTRAELPIERLLPRQQLADRPEAPLADLFVRPPWTNPAKPAPVAAPAPLAAAPPAPPPSFAAYRLIGKKLEAEVWEVFLSRDDLSFVVREGETLESTWRIDRIAPPQMTLTHLPTGQPLTFAIGDAR